MEAMAKAKGWLEENMEPRAKSVEAQQWLEQTFTKMASYPPQAAPEDATQIKEEADAALQALEDGNFKQAAELFTAVTPKVEKLHETWRTSSIPFILAAARQAAEKGHWTSASAKAEEILDIDKNHEEAKTLLSMAHKKLAETHGAELLDEAEAAWDGGNQELARAKLLEAKKLVPESSRLKSLADKAGVTLEEEDPAIAGDKEAPLLRMALDAKAKKDWNEVLQICNEILKAVPDHPKATELAAEAKEELDKEMATWPKLLVIAKMDTRTVNGEFAFHGKTYRTGKDSLSLPTGSPIFLKANYDPSYGGHYEGTLETTVDWEGKKSVEVPLHRFEGPRDGRPWALPLNAKLSLQLTPIPAGDFFMGSPLTEIGRDKEEIMHPVRFSRPFWMGQTEVTQAQYRAIMGENPSKHLGDKQKPENTLPVENVSWGNAKRFCERLTELERKAKRLPEGYVYQLPTEAQWEYACRAGQVSALNNGQDLDAARGVSQALEDIGWYDLNAKNDLAPCAKKKPNAWGLYDMHGNVEEWCQDYYAPYAANIATAQENPKGATEGEKRVARGGSWRSQPWKCRAAARTAYAADLANDTIGFRVVLAPKE
jgi:formylglycine-generating enzyme required for sulfatase activity